MRQKIVVVNDTKKLERMSSTMMMRSPMASAESKLNSKVEQLSVSEAVAYLRCGEGGGA